MQAHKNRAFSLATTILFPFRKAQQSRYHKLTSYLLYLEQQDESVVNQIKCSLFNNDSFLFQAFLNNKFPLNNAKKYCNSIYEYFEVTHLPINEVEYRKMKYSFLILNDTK